MSTVKNFPNACASEDEDFWQGIAWLAYLVDGDRPASQRQRIDHFLTCLPEVDPSASVEMFRRRAVLHLLQTLRPVESLD